MGNRHSYLPHILLIAMMLAFSFDALPQEKEKPKPRDFGSSLKRPPSNEKKKPRAESTPKPINQRATTPTDDIDVVTVETSLVTSDVLVLDKRGNPVTGLADKDFVVTEDGQRQEVGMVSLGDNIKVPRSIVLIIDYSSSQSPFIQTSIAA